MNDTTTLLATILENPSDDTARLVLADLLRESDDPDEQARGRFLWGGVTVARATAAGTTTDAIYRGAMSEVTSVIEEGYPARWLSRLGIGPTPLIRQDWRWKATHDQLTIRIGEVVGLFTHGMLSELTLPLGEWYDVGSAALAQWPLDRVEITDVPGLTFRFRIFPPAAESQGTWALVAGLGTAVSHESFPDRQALVVGMASVCDDLVDLVRYVNRRTRPARG